MPRRDNDNIGHVPKMTPAHDEIASYQRNKSRGSLKSSLGDIPENTGTSSTTVKSVLTVVILLLVITSAGSVYLYLKLQKADSVLQAYDARITDLEQRLSVTDESMSESSVAMKVKLRELDTEVRKLWDNVWKKSKQRFAEYDSQFKRLEQGVKRGDNFITTTKQQLSKIAKLYQS